MSIKWVSLSILALILPFCVNAADAPSLHQVYEAAQAGKVDSALEMMDKVLKEHPESGKAHFVRAELLAKLGRISDASSELKAAERLAPGLVFAKPQAIEDLRNKVRSSHSNSSSQVGGSGSDASSGIPWMMILIGIGVIALVLTVIGTVMRARNASKSPASYVGGLNPAGQLNANPSVNSNMNPNMNPSAAAMAPSGGLGSNLMGGLATGVAMGAGVVAGQALMHHFLDGKPSESSAVTHPSGPTEVSGADMGGNDFGIADNSSWEGGNDVAGGSGGGSDDWS